MTAVQASPRPAVHKPLACSSWAWRSGPCTALEHHFELFVEETADFPQVMRPLLAPLSSITGERSEVAGRYEVRVVPGETLRYTLTYDGDRVASGRFASDLTGVLAWHINQKVIERTVPHFVLLHAAAAMRDGMTVILPADQESGKTTTVAGLLRSGFDYVTDEAVALDPATGWVRPFPKTLSLDPGSWHLFPECRPRHTPEWSRQWQSPVEPLGARYARRPVHAPRVIVFPRYVPGAATTVHPMRRAEAVQELARMSFEFPRYAGRNLALFGRLTRHASTARLVVGSLTDAVTAIEALISERIMEEL